MRDGIQPSAIRRTTILIELSVESTDCSIRVYPRVEPLSKSTSTHPSGPHDHDMLAGAGTGNVVAVAADAAARSVCISMEFILSVIEPTRCVYSVNLNPI